MSIFIIGNLTKQPFLSPLLPPHEGEVHHADRIQKGVYDEKEK